MATDYLNFFKNKAVTQMGLGLLGRGVGDAAFLAQQCRQLCVTDAKSAADLQPSVAALKDHSNIRFELGGHRLEDFSNIDFVIKGAGVRLDDPYIAHARKSGVPVYMSTALFAYLSRIKTIGVTGTRGKTTTTSMIADILKRAGKKTLLGGNIRGLSTLALLPEADRYDYAVLELDSWQLQGFDSLGLSPSIGVFTNFYPDHLNYYDGDMGRYLHDKAALFRHQQAGDILITTPAVADLAQAERAASGSPAEWLIVDQPPASIALQIPGDHNVMNAALAAKAAECCGVAPDIIAAALHDFTGVEGRLQYVGGWQGRTFYNDSNATTQEATLAALKAFPPAATVLIFGGADKGLPLDDLIAWLTTHKTRAVLIKGTGSDRIRAEVPNLPVAASMTEAMRLATNLSHPGDTIILSPGFASFGLFKNEYDRSDQFLTAVRQLQEPA